MHDDKTGFFVYNIKKITIQMSEISVFLRHAKRNHNTSVDLSHRDLSFIPKQLLTLRNVEHLNLSNNKLECIESSIVELYKLKQLDLSYNLLTEIPVEISSLPMLDKLNLEGNPLSPDFEMLLVPANCSGERLANTLKQCFQREVKSKVSTPEWLIEGSTKNLVQKPCPPDLQWQAELPQPPKQSRQTSRQKKQCQPALNQPVPQFKNNILQIKIEDLEICEQISMGGFSTIHRGNFCGIEVAVKKIFNPNINQDLINQFNNQLMMLSRYRHPHIVLMVGAVTVPPVLCIVMECCRDGTLYDLLHKRKTNLSEKDKTKITTQILQTLNFLHKHGIVHRDLKSHNILLTPSLDIKLCDFGLARHKSQLNTGPMQYSGTPTYMAQELFLKKLYDMSVDVFALGTLLYELYAGEVPYAGVDVADIRERVLKDSALGTKVGVKRTVLQIINRCRLPEPANRPTVEELLKFQDW